MKRSFQLPMRPRSLSDPFESKLRPPDNESPIERTARLERENIAKKVSDDIDEQIRLDRAEQRRQKDSVKVLLLGQSESGKSTTLKRAFYRLFSSIFAFTKTHHHHHSAPICRVPAFTCIQGILGRTQLMAGSHLSQSHPLCPSHSRSSPPTRFSPNFLVHSHPLAASAKRRRRLLLSFRRATCIQFFAADVRQIRALCSISHASS